MVVYCFYPKIPLIDFSNAPITKKREIHGFLFSKNCGPMAYGRLLAHGRLLIYRVECMMVVYSHMVLYSEGESTVLLFIDNRCENERNVQ